MITSTITSRLHGGLGNQMFQYAVGRAIALRTQSDLLLDLRYFDGEVPFGFGLPHFHAVWRAASRSELPPHHKNQPLRYGIWRALKLKPRLVREKGLGYFERISEVKAGSYLHGYWQSERYFADVADTIRSDLTVRTPPSKDNAAMLERIGSGPSISLHVRRGDYAKDPAVLAAHGLCSPDYYAKAVDALLGRMAGNPVIYIFSDDPDWAEENLAFEAPIVVMRGNDSTTSHEDLRLMSACDHHVIANSSFSWWGAWLNPSPDKIVVAPRQWFAHPQMKNPDICPQDWLRL